MGQFWMQINIVVKDSEVLPVKAGQEIRFPVEAKESLRRLIKIIGIWSILLELIQVFQKFVLMMTLVLGYCLIKKTKLILKHM